MGVDQFTKRVECIPLSCQSAEVTARPLVNDFFLRFGFPLEIFSDQGRKFQSHLFAKLCEITQHCSGGRSSRHTNGEYLMSFTASRHSATSQKQGRSETASGALTELNKQDMAEKFNKDS